MRRCRRTARLDLRIVHLPLRYSGITDDEARLLADAMDSMERPIYVHCHHGTNRNGRSGDRSRGDGGVDAGPWHAVAGAQRDGPGIRRSVRRGRIIECDTTGERLSIDQVECRVEALPVLMAEIDESWSVLKDEVRRGRPAGDAAARSAALVDLLRVAFDGDANMESDSYRALADQVVVQATALEHALRNDRFDRLQSLVDAVGASCTACHRQHRN